MLLAVPIPDVQAGSVSVTKKYLMAFHGCKRTLCNDIQNQQVYLAESDDGSSWNLVSGWEPFTGSVPDVVRRGSTLYIYYVKISDGENLFLTKVDLTSGQVQQGRKVNFQGTEGHFVDPSLFLEDDGHIFLTGLYVDPPPPPPQIPTPSNPAACPPGQTTCVKQILSATEVAGSDGQTFKLDSGARAKINLDQMTRSASDPDLFKDKSGFSLYVSIGQSVWVYSSSTLRGEYSRTSTISNNSGGIPSGYFETVSGKVWTFVHADQPSGSVIRFASHQGYDQPIATGDFKTVISAQSMGLSLDWEVASPGFGVNVAGTLLNSPTPTPTPTPSATVSMTPSPTPTIATSSSPSANSSSTATSTIAPKPSTMSTKTSKLITITCVKGKLTKKVSGINPKCPNGYSKK